MPASWAADSVRPGGRGPACRHRTGAAKASAAAALREQAGTAVVAPADEQRHRVRGPGAVEVDEDVRAGDHVLTERRGQPLGRLAGRVAREGAGEVATVDRGGPEARHVGRLVGDRHEPEPAAERRIGQPVGQGQAGGHALELVAVDPTDDRQGRTVSATDQVDQRETLRPVGGGGDPLSPRMGHHGAVRIVPPALTSRGWIVDNLTGAASPNAGRKETAWSTQRTHRASSASPAPVSIRRRRSGARRAMRPTSASRGCSTPGSCRASTPTPGSARSMPPRRWPCPAWSRS